VRRWGFLDIDSVVEGIAGKGGWPVAADARSLGGAVLLHVDAALEARAELSLAEHDNHQRWATRLLGCLRDRTPPARPSPREFYVAFASAELFFANPAPAQNLAEDGLRTAPGDADLLLLSGCAQETLSLLQAGVGQRREANKSLRGAERRLREALVVDPSRVETRLRLGRVLSQQDRLLAAEPLLEPLAKSPTDEPTRYLALLFLGDMFERRGRPHEAIEAYQAALRLVPVSQAASIALAHAQESQEEPTASALLLTAARASSSSVRGSDPWWSYPFGPRSLGVGPLERLRERARTP
jgi:tetratricopeptide (TPR) repeat protein